MLAPALIWSAACIACQLSCANTRCILQELGGQLCNYNNDKTKISLGLSLTC